MTQSNSPNPSLEAMQNTPEPMDKGPWNVFNGQTDSFKLGVLSEDFTRDVLLTISGDFEHDGEKAVYAKWLADELNRAQRARNILLMVRNRLTSNNQAIESLFDLYEVKQ